MENDEDLLKKLKALKEASHGKLGKDAADQIEATMKQLQGCDDPQLVVGIINLALVVAGITFTNVFDYRASTAMLWVSHIVSKEYKNNQEYIESIEKNVDITQGLLNKLIRIKLVELEEKGQLDEVVNIIKSGLKKQSEGSGLDQDIEESWRRTFGV